jgi:hypothetical protein
MDIRLFENMSKYMLCGWAGDIRTKSVIWPIEKCTETILAHYPAKSPLLALSPLRVLHAERGSSSYYLQGDACLTNVGNKVEHHVPI